MSDNVKISVIMPVYNAEKYLETSINSVLNQTYKNLELILVDDGSTDKSGGVCNRYEKQDCRVKVIHRMNGGLPAARNSGLVIAKGEWISFVDADDWLALDTYAEAVKMMQTYDLDLIEFGQIFTDKEGRETRRGTHTLPKLSVMDKQYIYDNIIPQLVHTKPKDDTFLGAWVTNKLFKQKILKERGIRFNEELHLWEDGIFTIEYMQYVNAMVALNGQYYYYRDTPNSLSHTFSVF